MKSLVISAHPEPKSFNARLSSTAQCLLRESGYEVRAIDLYALDFDPRERGGHYHHRRDPDRFFVQDEQRFNHDGGSLPADVARQLDDLLWADLLVLQFPLWWFGVPAILKGWMDRVFVYGGMYSSRRRFDSGVCRGKRALLSVTAGSSAEDCSPTGREGDTRLILWPVLYSLHYVGFDVLEPVILYGIHGTHGGEDPRERDAHLGVQLSRFEQAMTTIDRLPTVPFNRDEDWDERGQLKPEAPSYSPFIRHAPPF